MPLSAPDPWARLIPNAVQFIQDLSAASAKPWLILGKGPTAEHRNLWNLNLFHVITLNHAALVYPAAALHNFVDWEAYMACEAKLQPQARIVLPWHPHRYYRPETETLGERLKQRVSTAALQFFSYNADNTRYSARSDLPTLRLRAFSATAAFSLLVAARQAPIYSLGIDGGVGYAPGFSMADHLINGQPSYDRQMAVIQKILAKPPTPWYRLSAQLEDRHARFRAEYCGEFAAGE